MAPKALIIGGGIGGLTAAIALRRAGLDAAVYEQAPDLREAGAGLTLWSNATRILHALGLCELEEVSAPLETGEIRNAAGHVLAAIPLGDLSRELAAPIVGIHRAVLLAHLARHVPPECIHLNHRLDSFSQDAFGVTAKFANGTAAEGDLLVGADGIHTIVRSQILGDPQRYCGYVGWRGVADLQRTGLRNDLSVWSYGRGAQFGLIPIGQDQVFWFGTTTVAESEIPKLGPAKEELLRRFGDWHEPIPKFLGELAEGSILRTPIYDRPPEHTWGRGRVTLLGDAAHATSPTLGQGACLAIESAYSLARHLSQARHVVPALRSYEAERQARTARIIRRSWRIGSAIQWTSSWACRLRDEVIRWTPLPLHLRSLRNIMKPGCMPLDLK